MLKSNGGSLASMGLKEKVMNYNFWNSSGTSEEGVKALGCSVGILTSFIKRRTKTTPS
jgi:hypothetical protein